MKPGAAGPTRRNNYSLNVHNGDMGKLIGIEKNHLLVRVHGIGKEIDSIREIPKDSLCCPMQSLP